MRNWLLFLTVLLMPAMASAGLCGPTPCANGQVIMQFGIHDTSILEGECARHSASDAAAASCTTGGYYASAPRDFFITEILLAPSRLTPGTDVACDIDVSIDSTIVTTFLYGIAALNGPGEFGTATDSAITNVQLSTANRAMSAGDEVLVRIDDPAGDTCVDATGCDCTQGASENVGFNLWILGFPN